ncbi:DUF4302 domain-containing protein [Sphingobacterium hotanense]|uniref:DUF4302 domain-containing protein n=1 Tax=Sphingobacterium hotanense TaxID=649196 RepID=UPI0021A75049|nr:DUF4302 domain-containing protein [Sphingobacterium hotanense]MCT1523906.1 DUF4302 domain-containing protein [Sphingobacterium hotanense]
MKKKSIFTRYIFALLSAALLTWGCEKESTLRNYATEKIDANFTNYDSLLTTSPNGWKFLAYPNIKDYPSNKGGFSFFMKFNEKDQRVTMVSDFNSEMGTKISESKYSIKFTSLSTLSFATYSYIHFLADPNTMMNGGEKIGWGHRLDFEYSILKSSPNQDTIYLKGNLQKTDAIMVRATADESKAFMTDFKYEDTKARFAQAIAGKVGLHVKTGNNLNVMTLSLEQRQVVFAKDISADSVFIHRTGIAYNGVNSIRLNQPFESDGIKVTELILNNGKLEAKDIQGKKVEVIEQEFPSIAAFKMFRTGAYTTIRIPYDNTRWITGYQSETLDWPHRREVQLFLGNTAGADLGISLGVITASVRFYDVTVQFKPAQKRFLLNVNFGFYDPDRPNAPGAGKSTPDEFYNKFTFPYQYRYTYDEDEVFTMYYEGPQFVYAAQFPNLKNAFKESLIDGRYSLKYTKTSKQLLIAFYDKRTDKVLFEGIPY